jgi:hypothetical protein
MVPKDENKEDKHDKEEVEFINLMSKNNRKKQKKKQKKIGAIKAKADRMDRAHMLLRETAHESDYEDTEAEIEHDKKISKHKPGQTRDTTKLPPKPPKDNHNKEKREAEHLAINSRKDLPTIIIEYRIDMDKGMLRTIVLDPMNTLFAKYTKDKLKPKPYHKANHWDRPLANVPGGRSFEAVVNKFLRLIRKEFKEDIRRSEMEGKVLEMGCQAGMLASTLEGIWARKFIVDTCALHPMDLLVESWQDDGQMIEHKPTRQKLCCSIGKVKSFFGRKFRVEAEENDANRQGGSTTPTLNAEDAMAKRRKRGEELLQENAQCQLALIQVLTTWRRNLPGLDEAKETHF